MVPVQIWTSPGIGLQATQGVLSRTLRTGRTRFLRSDRSWWSDGPFARLGLIVVAITLISQTI